MARNPIIEVTISDNPGAQLTVTRLDSGKKTYDIYNWRRMARAWWFYHNVWRLKYHGLPSLPPAFHIG